MQTRLSKLSLNIMLIVCVFACPITVLANDDQSAQNSSLTVQPSSEGEPWSQFLGEWNGEAKIVDDDMGEKTIGKISPIVIKFLSNENDLSVLINDERINQFQDYQVHFTEPHSLTISWSGNVFVLPARIIINLTLNENTLVGDQKVTLFDKDKKGNLREHSTVYTLKLAHIK